MQVTEANKANPDDAILYRSGMNPKIQRNLQVFTPCDFSSRRCGKPTRFFARDTRRRCALAR